MSAAEKLLSEDESAMLAGVSVQTIQQYLRFGLLDNASRDGGSLIRKGDVESLFHLGAAPNQLADRLEIIKESSETEAEEDNSLGALRDKIILGEGRATNLRPLKSVADKINFTLPSSGPKQSSSTFDQTPAHTESVSSTITKELELIEINRSLREQVKMLREERDWLRERLERLESRSEREQMLLLAESETVRRLISERTSKRSFWAFALPWLGEEKR